MEDWLSFIIFAGLFYFMMRYGCGVHMIHGHHGKHHHNEDTKHIDPVCCMEIDVNKGYGKMHAGTLYRFCSRGCLDKFEIDPDRYRSQSDSTEGAV